jgi:hypothetical protein
LLLCVPIAGAVRTLLPKSRPADGADFLLVSGAALAGLFLVVNGVAWWFPRYECPAWPLLLAGGLVWASRHWEPGLLRPSILLAGGSALLALGIGDLAYLSLHELKLASIDNATRPVLVSLAWKTVLMLSPLAVWPLLAGRRRWAAALPALLVGPALAMNLAQLGYEQTSYAYGTSGAAETIQRLRSLPPGSTFMGPYEAVLLTSAAPVLTGERDYDDPARFLAKAGDPACRAVVMSLGRNSVAHFQLVRAHPQVSELLRTQYRLERIGDYWVWLRR